MLLVNLMKTGSCWSQRKQVGKSSGAPYKVPKCQRGEEALTGCLFIPDQCGEPEGQVLLQSRWLHPKLLIQSFQVALRPLDKLVYIVQTNPIFGSEHF